MTTRSVDGQDRQAAASAIQLTIIYLLIAYIMATANASNALQIPQAHHKRVKRALNNVDIAIVSSGWFLGELL